MDVFGNCMASSSSGSKYFRDSARPLESVSDVIHSPVIGFSNVSECTDPDSCDWCYAPDFIRRSID